MFKRSKKYCSVQTCVNYYNLLGEICFSFPKNKEAAQDWILAINNPTLNLEDAHTYHRTQSVCRRHFAPYQFTTTDRVRLNRGVVPTLFLPSRDNCENGLSASEIQKAYLSSARKGTIHRFAEPVIQADYHSKKAGVKDNGTHDEARDRPLPHLDIRTYRRAESNVRNLQPQQEAEERTEEPVQEESESLTDSTTECAVWNGNQTDLQNVCGEQMTHVCDTAVEGREPSEKCGTECNQGDSDDNEVVKVIPNESYTVATDTWEDLPNQICRLCAFADEHPKQSIVGWLGMLNEIIPDLVAVDDGLPQHVCRPCTNKLYTCCKIRADFIEAYTKLQECLGFTKTSGIQFLHIPEAVPSYQTLDQMNEPLVVSELQGQFVPEGNEELVFEAEEQSVISQVVEPLVSDDEVQLVSQVEEPLVSDDEVQLVSQVEEHLLTEAEEHLVSVAPPDVSGSVLKTSNKVLHKGKETVLNTVHKLPMKIQESVVSCTDNGTTVHGEFMQDKPDSIGNTSHAYDIKVQKVGKRKKKYKYVCGECEEMFTIKGDLCKHKLTHSGVVFKCIHCNKQYSSVRHLNNHTCSHTKELPFMCEKCGKCFRTALNLSNHKYVHKPRTYACEVCNKKFSSGFYLTQHKKVHSLDRKLMCEVCGKMIYTPFTLKIHMRTHTGEKPFKCAACGRCFISAARLKTHRLVHTERKFQCFICDKEYYFKSSLIKHQESHNALEEYRCPICFMLFANSDNMRRHGKVYCKHPLCTLCGHTLLSDEIIKKDVIMAVRNRIRQRLKCCSVYSHAIHGRANILKQMKVCHKNYGCKAFECERCVKTLTTADVLHVQRT